jgi:hypothetical protein
LIVSTKKLTVGLRSNDVDPTDRGSPPTDFELLLACYSGRAATRLECLGVAQVYDAPEGVVKAVIVESRIIQ